LQRVNIACHAERCISYDRFRPSAGSHSPVGLSCQNDSSYDHVEDSSMTLVSSWLTTLQNSKGNLGSGAPSERG